MKKRLNRESIFGMVCAYQRADDSSSAVRDFWHWIEFEGNIARQRDNCG